jgi:penicillin amidase
VSGRFDPPYRAHQVEALLKARRDWRAEDMLAVQKDVYSGFAHLLARQFVAACQRRKVTNPALTGVVGLLREWNGQMEPDSAAAFIVTLGFQHLRKQVAERAAPGKAALYDHLMAPAALEKLLRERPAGWFADWDRLLVEVLADAVEEGRRMQGREPRKWRYGRYHKLTVSHPVGHHLPLVSRYFDLGPEPLGGSATTVKKAETVMGYLLGPSMRMAMEVGDWDRSVAGLVAGQSGHVLSRHYKDQWAAYRAGRAFPFRYRQVEAAATLLLEPQ